MKRGLILSLILLMFIVSLSSVNAYPKCNDTSENYATNTSEYTYQRNFGFQATCSNGTESANSTYPWANIKFELTNVEGVATNYTNNTGTITVSNLTYDTWYINFTQEQLGRATNTSNSYSYRWYAEMDSGVNVTASTTWFLNKSTATSNYMNVSRRINPLGSDTVYQAHVTGINLSYSSPISQNITGWYDARFTGNGITFTLYKDDISQGTSNPQSVTVDYTDQTDTWNYSTAGNVNYTLFEKVFTVTYTGGTGGGSGGSAPPPSNVPCPYECCVGDSQYIDKPCDEGTCINSNCIVGVTTTPYVPPVTAPGMTFNLPILGEVEIGMNMKFIVLTFIGLIALIFIIYLIYVIVK